MNSDPENNKIDPRGTADYSEKHDISNLHSAAVREKNEPTDGNEPLAIWQVVIVSVILFAGGIYLERFSGGFDPDVYDIYAGSVGGGDDAGEGVAAELSLVEIGAKVYRQNCTACHGANGAGVPGAFPPLAGAEWVTGSEKRLTGILLDGLVGPVEVLGNTYNGVMQPWKTTLDDEKIAAVMTYIRQEWGNDAPEISPEKVAAAREIFKDRKESWTAPELLEIPADAVIPVAEAAVPAESDAPPAEEGADEATPQEAEGEPAAAETAA